MSDSAVARSRIFSYINENGLNDGDPLPSDEALALLWGCGRDVAAATLEQGLQQNLISRRPDGSMIVSIPVHHEADFSFARSAARLEDEIASTAMITHEVALRLPLKDENPLEKMEERARQALSLAPGQPFFVIPRIRMLGGKPRAVHRAYLNPARFKLTFLDDHDFATESLIRIYETYGYILTGRDTTLTARLPNLLEQHDLGLLGAPTPVLVAEQRLFAIDPATNEPLTLEFLQATYLQWQYRIENRGSPRPGR